MIRLLPNDLIAISSGSVQYYALVLGRQILFGGSLCYVFHERFRRRRDSSYFIREMRPGFHAIVDWIGLNREKRVTRVAKGVEATEYKTPEIFKHTLVDLLRDTFPEEPKRSAVWTIVNKQGKALKRTRRLSRQEKRLPDWSCLSGNYALKLARQKWVPEADERIEDWPDNNGNSSE